MAGGQSSALHWQAPAGPACSGRDCSTCSLQLSQSTATSTDTFCFRLHNLFAFTQSRRRVVCCLLACLSALSAGRASQKTVCSVGVRWVQGGGAAGLQAPLLLPGWIGSASICTTTTELASRPTRVLYGICVDWCDSCEYESHLAQCPARACSFDSCKHETAL